MIDLRPEAIMFLLLRLPVLLLALTIHEAAHAWTADRLGDPTARSLGRVSLNPLRHLDPLGTICLLFAPIGWAKPVPVNPYNFRHPGRDDILVSAAGPASNLIQALIWALLLRLPWDSWADSAGGISVMQGTPAGRLLAAVFFMAQVGVILNVGLALFNLLPFAPLDGHHIARENLHGELRQKFIEMQPYGMYCVIGLIVLDHMLVNAGHPGPISWPIYQLAGLLFRFVSGFSG